MEQHLYDRLSNFNKKIPNDFKQSWGSALNYIDGAQNIAGRNYDEVEIYTQFRK